MRRGSNSATFSKTGAIPVNEVALTEIRHEHLLLAETIEPHFLRGQRSWQVMRGQHPNELILRTTALERFNGYINQKAAIHMGFRNGGQHAIWTEYFQNTAVGVGAASAFRPIIER